MQSQRSRGRSDLFDHILRQAIGGDGTSGITRMDTSLFNVFHDSGNDDIFTIADGIHIDFGRIFEEAVNQD